MDKPNVYFGAWELPKGKRRGTIMEALDAGQIKYYGINAIDPELLDYVKKKKQLKKNVKITKKDFIVQSARKRGALSKIKREIKHKLKMEQDDEELQKFKAEGRKIVEELKQLNTDYERSQQELDLPPPEIKPIKPDPLGVNYSLAKMITDINTTGSKTRKYTNLVDNMFKNISKKESQQDQPIIEPTPIKLSNEDISMERRIVKKVAKTKKPKPKPKPKQYSGLLGYRDDDLTEMIASINASMAKTDRISDKFGKLMGYFNEAVNEPPPEKPKKKKKLLKDPEGFVDAMELLPKKERQALINELVEGVIQSEKKSRKIQANNGAPAIPRRPRPGLVPGLPVYPEFPSGQRPGLIPGLPIYPELATAPRRPVRELPPVPRKPVRELPPIPRKPVRELPPVAYNIPEIEELPRRPVRALPPVSYHIPKGRRPKIPKRPKVVVPKPLPYFPVSYAKAVGRIPQAPAYVPESIKGTNQEDILADWINSIKKKKPANKRGKLSASKKREKARKYRRKKNDISGMPPLVDL